MTQTIERTGKGWKAIKAIGVTALVCGGGSVVIVPETMAVLGTVIALAGVALILVANIGAWWFHG